MTLKEKYSKFLKELEVADAVINRDWVIFRFFEMYIRDKNKKDDANREPGQRELIKDLELLIGEAKAGEFGEFTNKAYPFPKVTLAENVRSGKYD